MKQSDTNAIANLYVESINKGADPATVSDSTYKKICDMVGPLKRQGVSLEDAIFKISHELDQGRNTDDLAETIERVWAVSNSTSLKARMLGSDTDEAHQKSIQNTLRRAGGGWGVVGWGDLRGKNMEAARRRGERGLPGFPDADGR